MKGRQSIPHQKKKKMMANGGGGGSGRPLREPKPQRSRHWITGIATSAKVVSVPARGPGAGGDDEGNDGDTRFLISSSYGRRRCRLVVLVPLLLVTTVLVLELLVHRFLLFGLLLHLPASPCQRRPANAHPENYVVDLNLNKCET